MIRISKFKAGALPYKDINANLLTMTVNNLQAYLDN